MNPAVVTLHKTKHLLAHVLVAAGIRQWPQATLGDSGETATGFYADFGLSCAPDEDELHRLNDEMARVLRNCRIFRELNLAAPEAAEIFQGQPWKLQQVSAILETDRRVRCYEIDGVVDVCDCVLKDLRELRTVHPEKFAVVRAWPVVWSDRGHDILFTRIAGEMFPPPLPCECCPV
ncbi:hypothetical protein OH491_01320 [Termitidicoccus mucosus]|uniref:hypothetical protein n=1 Tax=Termitidicoccus mucosus TaxID=1184151 RepID=UPI0011AB8BD3